MEQNKQKQMLDSLRNTLVYYQNPTEVVGEEDWEVLKYEKELPLMFQPEEIHEI